MVTEIFIKVYCLQDINKKEVSTQLSKLIDCCLMENEATRSFHLSSAYKHYSFGGLKPIEMDGIYKRGNIYTFNMRTLDMSLVRLFKANLAKQYTKYLKVLTVEDVEIKARPVDKIYTLTPVILKFDTGYWRSSYSESVFEKRIRENMIKKYNHLHHANLNEDFELFNYIKFDNRKPVAFHYKQITLLGDKVTLGISSNETAQEIARLAIGSGLGEVNARGAGFVGYKYL